jgi:chaperone modulatory protein CbpM
MHMREFLIQARLDAQVVESWLEAGWLAPRCEGKTPDFSEMDLARARLIHELRQGLGVNDEGVPIILDLIDQLHGLRRTLRELVSAMHAHPDAMHLRILDDIIDVADNKGGEAARAERGNRRGKSSG